jgi:hypothetical protein
VGSLSAWVPHVLSADRSCRNSTRTLLAQKKKKARARLFLFLFRIRTSFLKFKKRKEKKKSVVAHSILRIEGFPDFCQTGLKV